METTNTYTATRNACKLCNPLGAVLAFKGIEGCIPFLHGSQGCSTYIRRYLISHFREPLDIASSNFSEATAIFGGKNNLSTGLQNVIRQYNPSMIGIASTCLSETIGDDIAMFLHEFKSSSSGLPDLINVSTPSYQGTHMEGFYKTLLETVKYFAKEGSKGDHVNLILSMISPEDIRFLKEVMVDFGLKGLVLPDYSETLDGGNWDTYYQLSKGGTSVDDIKKAAGARATLQLGRCVPEKLSVANYLSGQFGVAGHSLGLPIGLRESDRFFRVLAEIAGKPIPEKYQKQRGRLLDAFADGHKYVFGVPAMVYGEEDLVVGLVSFLDEIGIRPVLAGTGESGSKLKPALEKVLEKVPGEIKIINGADFETMAEIAREIGPEILIGHSKGYYISRELDIPLVRIGFPIHDRLGGNRVLHLGYAGAMQLFDNIANAVIQKKQDSSPVGYKYM